MSKGMSPEELEREISRLTYEGVRGWLLLFCVILTVVTPLLLVPLIAAELRALVVTVSPLYEVPTRVGIYAFASILFLVLLTVLSVRAGVRLWRKHPQAVRAAKRFLFLALVCAIWYDFKLWTLAHLSPEMWEALWTHIGKPTSGTLVFFIVWYLYLKRSKRVKATYPAERLTLEVEK